MRVVACFLLFLSSAVLVLSCSVFVGTPMQGNCRYLPSVEECHGAADRYITDDCLRTCIRRLCSVGKTICDAPVQLYCATRQAEGAEVGGYVPPPTAYEASRSCTQPREEINWCQRPLTPPCQEQNMIHELAHACGWHHN